MINAEYNIKEMQQFLSMTGGLYDIVRLVDPVECREITITDGKVHINEGCYNVWDSGQRCINCSSYKACMGGQRREKEEFFADKVYHILSNPVKLRLDDGTLMKCVIEFITSHTASEVERERVNDRAGEVYESASLIDPLTGLLNWDGFHQGARKLILDHEGEPCLIIACDIIKFKLINSLFGRQKGNDVLIEIAGLLRPYASDDILVGRLQADQFALCMPKALFSEETLALSINEIANLLNEGSYRLRFQAGVYEITDPDLPIAVMYDRAVMANVATREEDGSPIHWFDESMLKDLLYQQEVTSGFERTLASGEYQIFIQPQVDADGRVLGGEALARWIRPDGTIVPPIRFIPVLEKAGLISRLDRYVWELAAKQLLAWKDTDLKGLYISVNISALDFYYIDVYRTFTELVEKYGIDRKKLKLEITETAVMHDAEKQILRVADLRSAGFSVEIDDFGAGYSSLSMLKDIEADVLKIDMGFLRETVHAERSRRVLESIVRMAGKLHMDTITEGVETREQVDMLSAMGCNNFQGFYFAKPMPVEEFERFAREHRG